jgi:hypothetical protein
MFEQQRAEMRVLANWADAVGYGQIRDLLRQAEYALAKESAWQAEMRSHATPSDIESANLRHGTKSCDTE